MNTVDILKKADLKLEEKKEGLALTDGKIFVTADFVKMERRLKKGVLDTELLIKASRVKTSEKTLTAIDATAGFGEDSFLLAAAGFYVQMYEKNPVIAKMLYDAKKRAEEIPSFKKIAGRMELVCSDSVLAIRNLKTPPDVIYLDPMFPARKKSALIKKKFQLLSRIELPCENEEELLMTALMARPRKVVVKRPAKGAYLAGKQPSYGISGSSVRYDVYQI